MADGHTTADDHNPTDGRSAAEGRQDRQGGAWNGRPGQERRPRLERRVKGKQEREAMIARQREQFRKRQRNKRVFNYVILAVIVLAAAYAIYAYSAGRNAPGEHDALAQCLTSKGVVMYGTEWCPHCQEQKREFGESFRYVTYINCDLNQDACKAAGVEGYPTWVFPGQPNAEGLQSLAVLAERAGCPQ